MRQCECSLFRMYSESTFSKTVLHFFSRSVEQTFSLTMHIFRHVISSPDIDQPHSCPNLGTPCTQIVASFLTADSTKIALFDSIDFELWDSLSPRITALPPMNVVFWPTKYILLLSQKAYPYYGYG